MILRRSLFAALLLVPVSSYAAAVEGLAGHWEGELTLPQRAIAVTVDLKQDGSGAWIGSFGIPTSRAAGLAADGLKVDGRSVSFRVPEAPGAPSFELTLGEVGELAGNMNAGGQTLPLRLKRTGEANVLVIPPSPAVPKEFEGDWEGQLDVNGQTLRLVLHLANQPDKTVKASFDSPAQGASGIRVGSVAVKEKTLEFEIPAAGANFKGAYDSESGAISGEFVQRGNSLPLVFKKSGAK